MRRTSDEQPIGEIFDKAWQKENFKCTDCDFSKLYVRTREMFIVREDRYCDVLERIAMIVNPVHGMCGKGYEALPEMIGAWLENRGDKAKMSMELKKLREENAKLALEAFRNNSK